MQACDDAQMSTLAERLKEAREDKGWRKADLQRAAKIKSASTLTDLEKGATESPQLGKIAEALGVNVLWLQYGRGPKYQSMAVADDQHQVSIKSATQEIIALRNQAKSSRPMLDAVTQIASKLDDSGLLKLHGFASCLLDEHSLSKAKQESSA